jgi:hypothetical protein
LLIILLKEEEEEEEEKKYRTDEGKNVKPEAAVGRDEEVGDQPDRDDNGNERQFVRKYKGFISAGSCW